MKEVRIDFVAAMLSAYGVGEFIIILGRNVLDVMGKRANYGGIVQCVGIFAGVTVFFLVRYLMIASGAFPPVFPLRFLPSWKRFINYYGVIYYDDNVNKICTLYKKGKMAEAAYEFSVLVGIDIREAEQAMGFWFRIYGEGIILNSRERKNKIVQ